MANILDRLHFHMPKVLAGAIGVGVGAALTALHFQPDLATLIGQAVGAFLGAGG